MGVTDIEDLIPGIIILISFIGIIGGLSQSYPSILDIPVLGSIAPPVHSLFVSIGSYISSWINLSPDIIAYIIEVFVILLCIWIIVKFGY